MTHNLEVINNNEPLNIFGWPLFLPVCIARDYYTLWTEERMQTIIAALKRKGLAVEINDMAHTVRRTATSPGKRGARSLCPTRSTFYDPNVPFAVAGFELEPRPLVAGIEVTPDIFRHSTN